jgi:hypothetical protein
MNEVYQTCATRAESRNPTTQEILIASVPQSGAPSPHMSDPTEELSDQEYSATRGGSTVTKRQTIFYVDDNPKGAESADLSSGRLWLQDGDCMQHRRGVGANGTKRLWPGLVNLPIAPDDQLQIGTRDQAAQSWYPDHSGFGPHSCGSKGIDLCGRICR